MSLTLLSTPYSHPDPVVKAQRAKDTIDMVANLLRRNVMVFSPVIYGLAIINSGHVLPDDWNYWQKYCEASVTSSIGFIYVVAMPGWNVSDGVKGEIAEAHRQGKKVFLIEFDTEGPLQILKEIE